MDTTSMGEIFWGDDKWVKSGIDVVKNKHYFSICAWQGWVAKVWTLCDALIIWMWLTLWGIGILFMTRMRHWIMKVWLWCSCQLRSYLLHPTHVSEVLCVQETKSFALLDPRVYLGQDTVHVDHATNVKSYLYITMMGFIPELTFWTKCINVHYCDALINDYCAMVDVEKFR